MLLRHRSTGTPKSPPSRNTIGQFFFPLAFLCAISLSACGGKSDGGEGGQGGTGGVAGQGGEGGTGGVAGEGGTGGVAGEGGTGGAAGQGAAGGTGGIAGEGGTGGVGGIGGFGGGTGGTGGNPGFQVIGSDVERNANPDASEAEMAALARGNHALTLALHRGAVNRGANAMLSTYSIRSAFGLLYPGARGDTAQAISTVLHFDADAERALTALNAADLALTSRVLPADEENELEAVQLRTSNAFWSRLGEEWREDYLATIRRNLSAGIYGIDFAGDPDGARRTINGWVQEETRDRIKDLLPEGSIISDTAAVLTNAVYFKAPWREKFEEESTRDQPFTLLDDSMVDTPMMMGSSAGKWAQGNGWSAAELSFRGNKLAMVFIVPDAGTFQAFEDALDADGLNQITNALQPTDLDIVLPKFEFETTAPLSDPLKELGMEICFTADADFSGMRERGGLAISGVFHKTFIAVEEGGAEAAAATAIVVTDTAAPVEGQFFAANRPFLFGIRDVETGLFLFFGRVVDPR